MSTRPSGAATATPLMWSAAATAPQLPCWSPCAVLAWLAAWFSSPAFFHRDGWISEVIDPDNQPPAFLARLYEEVSPDGAEHYPVIVAKLARMHTEEPTLAASDLNGVTSRTLVMIGERRRGPLGARRRDVPGAL